MHQNIERAFNEIDAAVFNGDEFINPDSIETLRAWLTRWEKRLKENEQIHKACREAEIREATP